MMKDIMVWEASQQVSVQYLTTGTTRGRLNKRTSLNIPKVRANAVADSI